MSAIYRVSGGVDTIFHGEILGRRYLARNPPKVAISRRYIADISHSQRESMRGQTRYSKVNALQCPEKPFCC